MSNNESKKDLLTQILNEAQAYRKLEDIEKLVDGSNDLSMIPIQPLYVSLRSCPKELVASVLPKLSLEQRQALRDIDLWRKDELDPASALYWLEVYSLCRDDQTVLDYIKSEDFLLSLKNQFVVQTFDVEDPMYPDGNNYFLTDDNLLLIEYPEDFTYVQELRDMIRRLYSESGVEAAYAFLFKMVVDSYQIMEESNYQDKIERLRDFGFVDYYEAINYNSLFASIQLINQFISHKKGTTGRIEALSLNQGLHSSSLVSYQVGMENIKEALSKVDNETRRQYLQFNFIRMVNARMTLDDALRGGSVAMSRVGNQTRQYLELGFDYIHSKLGKDESIFGLFDFLEIYKVGHSLIEITRKEIKRSIHSTPFEKDDFSFFLGMYWNSFIENSFEEVAKYKFDGSSKSKEINSLENFNIWNEASKTFTESVPFIQKFFLSIEKLKTEGLLNDQFYLNYEVDNIDFESIIISSFINFVGGHYQETSHGKMGVTILELKEFYHNFFHKNGSEYLIKGEEDPVLREKALSFIEKFGLDSVEHFDKYLYQILLEQLNGYEIDSMSEEDFKHVGGPILLNYTNN